MQEAVLRKLFLGFIQIHILHHGEVEPFYGSWMINELANHGYDVSPGTIYPILHNLEKSGLLEIEKKVVEGKSRKYYTTTMNGSELLKKAKVKIKELTEEL